mgnify:CR=1 FL=1
MTYPPGRRSATSVPTPSTPSVATVPISWSSSSIRYSAVPVADRTPSSLLHVASSNSPSLSPAPDTIAPVTNHSRRYRSPSARIVSEPEYSSPNPSSPFTSQRPTNGSASSRFEIGFGAVNHASTTMNSTMPIAQRTGTDGSRRFI